MHITLGEGDVIPGVERALEGMTVGERNTGERYEVRLKAGSPLRVRVLDVEEAWVRVDANHPLAGQPLNFELELASIG